MLHYLEFEHKLRLQTPLFPVVFDSLLLRIVKFLFRIHDPHIDDDQFTYDSPKDDDYSFILPFHWFQSFSSIQLYHLIQFQSSFG
jgi:hypothetical protein